MKIHLRFLSVIAAATVAVCFLVCYAGIWLLVSDPEPQHLDYVCTFGGERARELYSFELVQRHPEATWLVSGQFRASFMNWLVSNKFDTSRVVYLDTCTDTWSETNAFHARLLEFSNVVAGEIPGRTVMVGLVSGPYHMRRISILAHSQFRENGPQKISVSCLPVPLEWYGHTRRTYFFWWCSRKIRGLVFSEIKKSLGALFGFR